MMIGNIMYILLNGKFSDEDRLELKQEMQKIAPDIDVYESITKSQDFVEIVRASLQIDSLQRLLVDGIIFELIKESTLMLYRWVRSKKPTAELHLNIHCTIESKTTILAIPDKEEDIIRFFNGVNRELKGTGVSLFTSEKYRVIKIVSGKMIIEDFKP